eukprot:CAMPEP_0170195464 /NCGR_PEP_ID=MMETSP0040_2-20121228/61577_1 /TAXON_ID=641309 /ORGANISM="Lotharella oceanica, Strain CCMP622" /LENGTH=205 /DNA_ID=CAMNT_0010444635 /DNA_START=338 /DNA_END=954 /DNA_ORIENTATION=+
MVIRVNTSASYWDAAAAAPPPQRQGDESPPPPGCHFFGAWLDREAGRGASVVAEGDRSCTGPRKARPFGSNQESSTGSGIRVRAQLPAEVPAARERAEPAQDMPAEARRDLLRSAVTRKHDGNGAHDRTRERTEERSAGVGREGAATAVQVRSDVAEHARRTARSDRAAEGVLVAAEYPARPHLVARLRLLELRGFDGTQAGDDP